jgi:hypothetical protein
VELGPGDDAGGDVAAVVLGADEELVCAEAVDGGPHQRLVGAADPHGAGPPAGHVDADAVVGEVADVVAAQVTQVGGVEAGAGAQADDGAELTADEGLALAESDRAEDEFLRGGCRGP